MNFVTNIFKKYSHKDGDKNEAESVTVPQNASGACTEVQPGEHSHKPRVSVLESFDPLYNQGAQDSDYEEAIEDLYPKKQIVAQNKLCDSISEEQAPFKEYPEEVLKRPRIDAIKRLHVVEKLLDITSESSLNSSVENYESIENSRINVTFEEEKSPAKNSGKSDLSAVEVIEILDDTVELDSSRTDLRNFDLVKSRESSGFVSTQGLTVDISDISINECSTNISENNQSNTFEIPSSPEESCQENTASTETQLNRAVEAEFNESSCANDSVKFVDSHTDVDNSCENSAGVNQEVNEVCCNNISVVDFQQDKTDDSVIVLDKSNQIADAVDESFESSKASHGDNSVSDLNVSNTNPGRTSIITQLDVSELENYKNQNGLQTISLNSTYEEDNSLNELNNTIETGDPKDKVACCPYPVLREISCETAEFEAIELVINSSEKNNYIVNGEVPGLTTTVSPVCSPPNGINLNCVEVVEGASIFQPLTETSNSLSTSHTEKLNEKVNSSLEINNECSENTNIDDVVNHSSFVSLQSSEIGETVSLDQVEEGIPALTKEPNQLEEVEHNSSNSTADLNETVLKPVQEELKQSVVSSIELNVQHKIIKADVGKQTRRSIETANPSLKSQKSSDVECSLNSSKNRKTLGAFEVKSSKKSLPLTSFVVENTHEENSLDFVKAADDKFVEALPNIGNKTIKNCENQTIKNIEQEKYCRPDNNIEFIGSSVVPDISNIGSLCVKNAVLCQEEKGNTTLSSPVHVNLNTSRKSLEVKESKDIHSVIVPNNNNTEVKLVSSNLDDELMTKATIQDIRKINTTGNLGVNTLSQVRKSSEFFIDNSECSVLDGNRNKVGPFIPHSDSDSHSASSVKSFLKQRSPSKSPQPSAKDNRTTYVIDSSFVDNNNSIEDISEKEVSKSKGIKFNMADFADKVSSQQQEISDLKLQLNASQQTIASLELQIRQKEEIIIKTQAEALKKEQGYGHEVKVLKEQLAEKSLLIDKDSTSEMAQQVEKLKAREAKLLSELNARNNDHLNYKKIMDEYEHTISERFADYQKLRDEHETATKHLANLEFSFSDVHSKYERSKAIIEGYKANEATLRHNLEVAEQTTRHHEEKYESLKAHAKAQIDKSNKEILQMRDRYEGEIGKLHAIIKRLEIKVAALEVSLEQKVQECTALSALCDEVTGKRV